MISPMQCHYIEIMNEYVKDKFDLTNRENMTPRDAAQWILAHLTEYQIARGEIR